MGTVTNITRVKFSVGDVVQHQRFAYRGVIVDVDSRFHASDEWYDLVAKSRPPKNKPWYHVLVHGSDHSTYVAERHLQHDDSGEPVDHPMMDHFFSEFVDGKYRRIEPDN
ncbi:MAG: heat shock protein HspQ [Pseudomonadales bacterium]|nr:heat shock protein HspQ [Pseudomonadales bacterium]